MLEFSLEWITGMMLGIEFPQDCVDDNVSLIVVVDLFIVRMILIFSKPPPIKPA